MSEDLDGGTPFSAYPDQAEVVVGTSSGQAEIIVGAPRYRARVLLADESIVVDGSTDGSGLEYDAPTRMLSIGSNSTILPLATESTAGLMSAANYTQLVDSASVGLAAGLAIALS